jgi:hypothetical protein
MVHKAHLYLKGHSEESKGISLLSCNFGFTQDVDQRGMPKSEVKGGLITVVFESTDDTYIIQWMISPTADKEGKIDFFSEEDSKALKTLNFKDARCVSYHESFVRDGSMITEITISAREINLSAVKHKNAWTKY